MAIALITEVWRHAPASLTPTEFIVLLRIADAAGEENRMMWESVATLSKYARCSERHVNRCLDALRETGMIEEPHESEWPPEAKHYRSVVRRIRPAEAWGSVTHSGDDNMSPLTPRSDNPKAITTILPVETTSLQSDVPPRAARRKRGKDQPPQEREFVMGQDPLEEPQEPRSRPNEVDPDLGDPEPPRRPQKASRGSQPGPDSGMGLALYFRDRTMAIGWGLAPVNLKALAGQIAEWKRAGVAAQDIRAMIDYYANVPGFRSDNRPPWLDFVAKRAALAHTLKIGQGAAEMESIRFDPDAWA